MTTVTNTAAAVDRAGIEVITGLPFTTEKQPGAVPQGSRTTGWPAPCSAVVPISIALTFAMLLPLMVTVAPPASGPLFGVAEMLSGLLETVPTPVVLSVAGTASDDETVVGEPVRIAPDVTPAAVTIATTLTMGSVVPPGKDEPLVVHAIVDASGAWHTQPEPNAPTGTTPAGTVCVSVIGLVSLSPVRTDAVAS